MNKRIAIITGANGGIGKEFAALMVKENVDEVWCIARNEVKLKALKEELGDKIRSFSIDLSHKKGIAKVSELMKAENAVVAYLINNAGIGERLGEYKDLPEYKCREIISLNCTAVASLCTICLAYMKSGSKIINLSSQSSFQPVPYLNLYASTKAFVTSFTRALNAELKKSGITATAICAGWAETDMLPKTLNGNTVKYPGLTSPRLVAEKGLQDAKKGKDISVCTLYVKYMQFLSKIFPHKTVMKTWIKSIVKYLE